MVNEGKVYLFLGGPLSPSEQPDWTYTCGFSEASCGYAVDSAGDVNQDGFDDILVGAPHYDNNQLNEGAAFLFFGSSDGPGDSPDWWVESDQQDARFGIDVAGAGDLNNDGFDDLLVGSSHFDQPSGLEDSGAAFVYLGSPIGLGFTFDWVAYGPESDSRFGYSVSPAGDVNLDGFDDLMVGAYLFGQHGEETQPDEGAVYLYAGSFLGPRQDVSWSAFGAKADSLFGYTLCFAGDLNADGLPDLAVGAPEYKFDEKTLMGRAFMYLNSYAFITFDNFVFIPNINKGN
jgi:hypothetical protein